MSDRHDSHELPRGHGRGEDGLPGLHDLLADAAGRSEPTSVPDFTLLRARARRRRRRRWLGSGAGGLAAAGVIIAIVLAGLPAAGSKPMQIRESAAPTPSSAPAAECPAARLAISTGIGQGATGHLEIPLLFRNTGRRSCQLSGYPSVVGLSATGQVAARARPTLRGFMGGLPPGTSTPPTVTLSPGSTATAIVEGTVNHGSTSCPGLSALQVSAPGSAHPVRLAVSMPDCTDLQVHPVTGGPASGSAPTVAPRTAAACRSAQLRISEKKYPGGSYLGYGLGHSAAVILFQNISAQPCTLYGYPGAAGLDAAGAQVTQASRAPSGYMGGLRPGSQSPPVVTLGPGERASALIEGTDNPVGTATTCPTLAGLLVTAPGTRRSVRLPQAPADCSGLQIHPVVAGTTGRQQG